MRKKGEPRRTVRLFCAWGGAAALCIGQKTGCNFCDPSKPLVVYLEQMFVVATLGFIHIQVGLVQYC